MKNLRRWLLSRPYALPLAADARLSLTDYHDDQVWELSLGIPASESPALVLQTRYGGRVGLASLVPMWIHDGRLIYQTQGYAKPPTITGFAPGYLRVQATLTPQLALQAEYWAIDSHAVGVRYTVANAHTSPTTISLELFAHVGAQGKEQPINLLKLPNKTAALHMGKIGSLNPVVVLEGASEPVDANSPKITREITIDGRKKVIFRFVHAGLNDVRESLSLAQVWLSQNWDETFKRIDHAAQFLPNIETGDENTDFALALSTQQLVLAYLKPTGSLPHTSFVAERTSHTGFTPNTVEYRRAWSGQAPHMAYLTALGTASIHPQAAQGIIHNYLAVQQSDGWIDWKPGLAGQRQGILCMPILARLAWGIYQYTEDEQFLKDIFPGLLRFFERWFAPDMDADGDGIPEWQSENQTGYVFFPSFAAGQAWGQNIDIGTVETPDLLAYLISEAMSLRAMAEAVGSTTAKLNEHLDKLKTGLQNFWQNGRYSYRDRDTHLTHKRVDILKSGQGDQEHILALPLSPASRVVVRVEGGVDHTPALMLYIEGLDRGGKKIREQADSKAFIWQRNRGAYTTQQVFSQVDRIRFDGLSRVYRVEAYTPDTIRLDINALMPLWAVDIPHENAESLVQLLTDPAHFWRANGITMNSALDPNFDPSNANGAGGVWSFWVTLMGEALVEMGRYDLAANLLQRLVKVQIETLNKQGHFTEFYHADEPLGLGEANQLSGVVPLHLFLRVIGVRIINGGRAWTGGAHVWPTPVSVTQHGVTVRRSTEGTHIRFASGHEIQVTDWGEYTDPNPVTLKPVTPITPKKPKTTKPKPPNQSDS